MTIKLFAFAMVSMGLPGNDHGSFRENATRIPHLAGYLSHGELQF